MDTPSKQQETPYVEKTFGDRNRLKRRLQAGRLQDALVLADQLPMPRCILDFGAGNGELCKLLVRRYPDARVYCYEPHTGLLEQARDNLVGLSGITLVSSTDELLPGSFDQVYCLEVFEHLPVTELDQAIAKIQEMLTPTGHAVIGVPIEVGLPALLKGIFRMLRRFGEHDASVGNILRCTAGHPPTERPAVELMPGSFYHLHHLGFDHRMLRNRLRQEFIEVGASTSPLKLGGTWLNSELTLLLGTRGG